jgi:hypothetical protein
MKPIGSRQMGLDAAPSGRVRSCVFRWVSLFERDISEPYEITVPTALRKSRLQCPARAATGTVRPLDALFMGVARRSPANTQVTFLNLDREGAIVDFSSACREAVAGG